VLVDAVRDERLLDDMIEYAFDSVQFFRAMILVEVDIDHLAVAQSVVARSLAKPDEVVNQLLVFGCDHLSFFHVRFDLGLLIWVLEGQSRDNLLDGFRGHLFVFFGHRNCLLSLACFFY
jgi:hypothetical protein